MLLLLICFDALIFFANAITFKTICMRNHATILAGGPGSTIATFTKNDDPKKYIKIGDEKWTFQSQPATFGKCWVCIDGDCKNNEQTGVIFAKTLNDAYGQSLPIIIDTDGGTQRYQRPATGPSGHQHRLPPQKRHIFKPPQIKVTWAIDANYGTVTLSQPGDTKTFGPRHHKVVTIINPDQQTITARFLPSNINNKPWHAMINGKPEQFPTLNVVHEINKAIEEGGEIEVDNQKWISPVPSTLITEQETSRAKDRRHAQRTAAAGGGVSVHAEHRGALPELKITGLKKYNAENPFAGFPQYNARTGVVTLRRYQSIGVWVGGNEDKWKFEDFRRGTDGGQILSFHSTAQNRNILIVAMPVQQPSTTQPLVIPHTLQGMIWNGRLFFKKGTQTLPLEPKTKTLPQTALPGIARERAPATSNVPGGGRPRGGAIYEIEPKTMALIQNVANRAFTLMSNKQKARHLEMELNTKHNAIDKALIELITKWKNDAGITKQSTLSTAVQKSSPQQRREQMSNDLQELARKHDTDIQMTVMRRLSKVIEAAEEEEEERDAYLEYDDKYEDEYDDKYDDKYDDDKQRQSVYGVHAMNHMEILFVIEMINILIISAMIVGICCCLCAGIYLFGWRKMSGTKIENIPSDNV